MKYILVFTLSLGISASGCKEPDKKKTDNKQTTSEPTVPPKVNNGTPGKLSLTETPADKLGTLPEGIGLAVGSAAPAGPAKNLKGEDVNLSDWLGKSTVAIIFYRGGWCPFCNIQIAQLTENFDELKNRDVLPIAISVDTPDSASATDSKYDIPFPVLSDSDLKLHTAYKVNFEVPEDKVKELKDMGLDLRKASGHDHHTIAVPSIFVIDKTGTIIWAHADEDYKTRPSVKQVLAALDAALDSKDDDSEASDSSKADDKKADEAKSSGAPKNASE